MLGNWLMFSPLDAQHPLFELNMRRRRWWQLGYTPKIYGLEVIAWTVMALLIAWVVFVAARYLVMVGNYGSSLNMPVYRVTEDTWRLLLWSGAVSIGLSYLLDFIVMAVTVNSINGERSALRWDLVQLTPLSGQSILQSMHMTNQLRLWRLTMIVIGTRVAILVAIVLHGLFVSPMLEDNTLRFAWSNALDYPIQMMYVVLLCSLIGAVAITEPIWRLRATTAFAMGISSQVQHLVAAMAIAFPLLLGIWGLMLGIAVGGIWLMVRTVERMYDIFPGYSDSEEMLAIIVIVGFFVAEAAYIYHAFSGIQRFGLGWALRRAITPAERWQTPTAATALPWWNGIRWWLPHSSVWRANPIFDLNVRRVRWWHSVSSPQVRMWHFALWAALGVVLLYTLTFTFVVYWYESSYTPAQLTRGLRLVIGAVAWIGVALLVGLDILASAATARTVAGLRIPIHDGLLRITHMTPGQVIAGIRALARLRLWTVVAVFLSLTITAICLFYSVYFAEWYVTDSIRTYSSWTYDFITNDLGWLCAFVISIVLVTLVKVRMVTALTLALALRLNGIMLELARAGMLIVLILFQLFILWWNGDVNRSLEWGSILGGTLLGLVGMAAIEQGALAVARHFWQRER